MAARTVKVEFTAPVHFGVGRLSDAAYACDAATLFSALYLEALSMGKADELLNAVRSGLLSISDAFPYIGATFYAPKPIVPPLGKRQDGGSFVGGVDSRARKASKKLEYIPVRQLREYLTGEFDPVGALDSFRLGKSYVTTKVNLTRDSKEDADPYHVGGYSFERGAGLYFLVDGDYDIEPVLDSLQYSGLGGKRSSGYGRFEYAILDENPFKGLSDTGMSPIRLLLSSAAPTRAELTDELLNGAYYRVVRKGGFVQSTTYSPKQLKKRDLYLFAAGSTFAHSFNGDVYDVGFSQGGHPVYRYARAMWAEV